MSERKFRPGDHVELRYHKNDPDPYSKGVILYESEASQMPCVLHRNEDDHDCWEWANVLQDRLQRVLMDDEDSGLAALSNLYSTHVGECRMRLSEFGQALRDY